MQMATAESTNRLRKRVQFIIGAQYRYLDA